MTTATWTSRCTTTGADSIPRPPPTASGCSACASALGSCKGSSRCASAPGRGHHGARSDTQPARQRRSRDRPRRRRGLTQSASASSAGSIASALSFGIHASAPRRAARSREAGIVVDAHDDHLRRAVRHAGQEAIVHDRGRPDRFPSGPSEAPSPRPPRRPMQLRGSARGGSRALCARVRPGRREPRACRRGRLELHA